MSYAKYTTDAFLLSVFRTGEADMMLLFYTKQFGLVRALAKSVRLSKSKLKPALEESNLLSISLVRGRDLWRLTDVEPKEQIVFPSLEFNLFLKITRLLKSLVHGEEENQILFEKLLETHNFLRQGIISQENLEALECVTVMRMLDALGYGRNEIDWGISISEPINEKLLKSVQEKKDELVFLINKSLKESHLA